MKLGPTSCVWKNFKRSFDWKTDISCAMLASHILARRPIGIDVNYICNILYTTFEHDFTIWSHTQ